MSLANERITLNPLEESLTNVPLELNGLRGMGIITAAQGSLWTPAATETPQLAQSVDTEGALNIATQIGTRTSPVVKFGVVEPLDPAGTNWALNPQCVSTGSAFTQVKGSGAASNVLVRDLIGYDYAELQVNPGSTSGEGITTPVGVATGPTGSITAGVWLKGVNGGEAVTLSLNATGTPTTSNVTLTTSWQWFTITQGSWSSASPVFSVVGQGSVALAFYATGWGLVPGTTFANPFDGTIPGCSWQGLPHASQSTRPAPGGPRATAIMGDLEAAVKLLSQYGGTIRRMLATQSGNTVRITYDVLNAQLSWDDMEYQLTGTTQGTITFICEPYGRGPEMTTETDSFNPLIQNNYVVDAGAFSNFTWGATGLSATANLSTENRFLYQGEYPFYSGEVQATFTPKATISGFKGGCIIERQDASNYIEGYVTDNGTHSFLNVDKIVAGSRTNELTVQLASRIANGTAYTVRIRVQRQNQNDNVYAEYFASTSVVPTTGVPTTGVGPYVITDSIFGAETPGSAGIVMVPETSAALATSLIISPYLARERTLPVLRFGLAGVPGTVPGLGRMDVSDCSNNNQLWAVWGQQHNRLGASATTSDLYYEAEVLTPVNAAAVTGLSGASGGSVVEITALPSGVSVPMLSTAITGIGQMTHTGSYNVWARCYSNSGSPSFQLQWGVGSLSVPTTNTAVTLPAPSAFYLLNLGSIRIPSPSVGASEWFGAIQANSPGGGDNASIDAIFFQPLDDGGAQMSSVMVPSAGSITVPSTIVPTANDSSNSGANAWVYSASGAYPFPYWEVGCVNSPWTSDYLDSTGFGFAISAAATIVGIEIGIERRGSLGAGVVYDTAVKMIKAGSVLSTNRSAGALWGYPFNLASFGGPTDLWGTTWTPAQVNASNFGVAVSCVGTSTAVGEAFVSGVTLTIYYTLGSGLPILADAVTYAGRTTEISSKYAQRTSDGIVWGPVGNYSGQYMKVPSPAYYDGVDDVLVKVSRGLPGSPDAGIDATQAQVSVTPRYAQVPDE